MKIDMHMCPVSNPRQTKISSTSKFSALEIFVRKSSRHVQILQCAYDIPSSVIIYVMNSILKVHSDYKVSNFSHNNHSNLVLLF